MRLLVHKIPKPKVFQFCDQSDKKGIMAKELNQYARNGELIISEPDYEGSNFERIESLIVSMQSSVNDEFSEIPGSSTFKTDESFISIVCPASEGKTQLAFALRRIKPIYFACRLMKKSGALYVCEKFRSMTYWLHECARMDFEIITDNMNTKVYQGMDISPDLIRSLDRSVPLWTVGYLMGLINVNQPYKTNETWMEYYARRSNFQYQPARIDDIPEGYFSGYCLYLDDFYTDDWTVYVRNLARTIGIRIICASRNTYVTGNVINERREAEDPSVWSVVAVKLNSPSLAVLNTNYDFEDSIKSIKAKALGNVSELSEHEIRTLEESNPICYFLNDFMSNQLKYMHPGVAIMIADAMKKEVKDAQAKNGFNLGVMLDTICRQLSGKWWISRSVNCDEFSFFAKTGLLLQEAYAKDQFAPILREADVEEMQTVANIKSMVYGEEDTKKREPFFNQRHNSRFFLYYLSNPHNPDSPFFLTFAPETGTASKSLLAFNYENELVTWNYKYTHFESNSILTLLACLFTNYQRSLQHNYNMAIRRDTFEFMPTQPPSKASKPLDTMYWAIMTVFSSMFSFGSGTFVSRKFSLSGQTGTSYIKNLVFNLIPDLDCHDWPSHVSINFNTASNEFNLISDFLDKVSIPFLYSIDRSIPILDKFSAPQSGIYVKPYNSTGHAEQLDGRFEIIFDGQVKYAEAIHKFQPDTLLSYEILNSIFTKSLKTKNTILSLIFCKRITEKPAINSTCYKYCKKNRINVYRIRNSKFCQYKVAPLFGAKDGIFSDPKLVAIVFEYDEFFYYFSPPCVIQ